MKLSVILFFGSLFTLMAGNGYSQSAKLSFELENATVAQILDEIEAQSKFRFIYNVEDVQLDRKISIAINKEKIHLILQQLFVNTNTVYKVRNKQIILTQSPKLPAAFQEAVIGVVTDEAGMPIMGVSVTIKGTNRGTTTNFDGEYSITVSPQAVLVFSYMGFKKIEIPVDGQREINVRLVEDITALKEVEINAGYYNTTRRESTGNISRITSKTIEQQPVINPLAAMQGRMPGVQITQTTGVPGGGFDIKIRGTNSLRAEGNAPLFIIDGVPYSSQELGDFNLSGSVLPGYGASTLNSINPSDIANIEVLKDADATAIYGSRGANGVILITTKRKEKNPGLTLNYSRGYGNTTRKLHLLNTQQYISVRKEAFQNDGIEIPSYAYDINGTWDSNRYTDWQDILIGGTAQTDNLQTSFSGGNANTSYLISGGYLDQTTVFPGDYDYKRTSAHANIHHTSEDNRFSINFSASYVSDFNNLPGTDFTREAQIIPPNAPAIYDEQGNLNWEGSTWDNPFRLLEGVYQSRTKNLITGAVINYEILKGLTIKANIGYNDTRILEENTIPSTTYDPAFGLGSEVSALLHNVNSRTSWIVEPQLNYGVGLGKGKLNILLGSTFQEQKGAQEVLYGQGFTNNNLIFDLASASQLFVLSSPQSQYHYSAVFGRMNYSLNDRYFVNITGRRDGSSRFGPGKQFANFGAVGAAWIFSEEGNLKNQIPFLSEGKLRASYGITGSDQIGDYQYLDTYSSYGGVYGGVIGLRPNRLYNPNFGWETNKKLEVALETGFFRNRIIFDISYFRNRSSNQLVGIPLPGTTGFPSVQANLDATVQNSGWEFELITKNINKENFQWRSDFNLSILKNKLISFPGLEASTYANQYVVGQPLNILKVYQYTGIDSETGIYQFKDLNGDGMISTPEDKQKTIKTAPDFFGGLSNSFTLNNWNLNFLLQFVKQRGPSFIASAPTPGTQNNEPITVLDRWQNPGDQATYQKYTSGINADAAYGYFYYQNSDAAITNASFIRLKNLSLSYRYPEKILQLFEGEIYLQGQNIFVITPYKGADPETLSTGHLPPLRTISLGTKINF